jgi:hypothetical protein
MRAYILTLHNVLSEENYKKIVQGNTDFEISPERLKAIKPRAAFSTKEEALEVLAHKLYEFESDYEERLYFQKHEEACLSLSIDVVEVAEDEFDKINSVPQIGKFIFFDVPIHSIPKKDWLITNILGAVCEEGEAEAELKLVFR